MRIFALPNFFSSPQVKRIAIIKHGIHILPQKLLYDLRQRILKIRKFQQGLKTSLDYSIALSLTPKMKILSTAEK